MSILNKVFGGFNSKSIKPDNSIYCKICGHQVSDEDFFCSRCGSRLKDGSYKNDEENLEKIIVEKEDEKIIDVINEIPGKKVETNNDSDNKEIENNSFDTNAIIDFFDNETCDDSRSISSNPHDDNTLIDIFESSHIKEDNSHEYKDDNFNLLKEVYAFIFKVFDDVNSDVVSIKCLFARMKIFRPELLEFLNADDIDCLYSELQEKLHQYGSIYFKKSYIGRISFNDLNDVVFDHFSSYEKITFDEYRDFQGQTGINPTTSFYSFIEKNHKYLLINAKEAIKYDDFVISNIDIEKMKNFFKLYFDNKNVLRTNNMNLIMFPGINNYPINKFLIVSIIKKYFNDVYKVLIDSVTIGNIDYSVRRIENETN